MYIACKSKFEKLSHNEGVAVGELEGEVVGLIVGIFVPFVVQNFKFEWTRRDLNDLRSQEIIGSCFFGRLPSILENSLATKFNA